MDRKDQMEKSIERAGESQLTSISGKKRKPRTKESSWSAVRIMSCKVAGAGFESETQKFVSA